MEIDIEATKKKRQIRIFCALGLVLLLIVFSPFIKGWLGSFLRPIRFRLANTEIAIPRGWLVSQENTTIEAWKPCLTVFCGLPSRASFLIKVSALPEAEWQIAARKTIEQDFSADATLTTIHRNGGSFKCLQAETASNSHKTIISCLNSNSGLTSTFLGDPLLKDVYVEVLETAQIR